LVEERFLGSRFFAGDYIRHGLLLLGIWKQGLTA